MDGFKKKPQSLTFLCFHYEEEKGGGVILDCVVLKDGKFSLLGVAAGGEEWGWGGVNRARLN